MSIRLRDIIENPPADPFLSVLGFPVDHSFSPFIHQQALDDNNIAWKYHAISVPEEDVALIPRLLNVPGFKGTNVTIPLKQRIREFVATFDDEVAQLGAANTLYHHDDKWKAANTDIYGFVKPLESFIDDFQNKPVVVLGSGGAARAVCYGLTEHTGVSEIYLISRSPNRINLQNWPASKVLHPRLYSDLPDIMPGCSLVVNTTPVGMHPDTDSLPLPEEHLPLLEGKICYDLIYNPRITRFLEHASKNGCQIITGLPMFIHQAAKSFTIWTGKTFPVKKAEELIHRHLYGEN